MSMDIYVPPGTRIQFAHPFAGYPTDQALAAQHLTQGEVYTVARTNVRRSDTSVYLQEVPGVAFNSVLFEEEDKPWY